MGVYNLFNIEDIDWKHDKYDLNNKSPRSGEVIYNMSN